MSFFLTLGGGVGFLHGTVPEDVRTELLEEIKSISGGLRPAIGYQANLAGHIKREYELVCSRDSVEKYILGLIDTFNQHTDYLNSVRLLSTDAPYKLGSLWVNFQRKNEYNPPHSHTGILSFVIWVEIPYDLEAERAMFPDMKPEANNAAAFNFLYTGALGAIENHSIHLAKKDEWRMALFPAKLLHYVNPFLTSDGTRISVSGNILLYNG